ncbi:hypothetical protein [Halalkalibacter urbisdiaboli]|uniref:hypothetical protein n=1 Tax=Halalkalibacter urbisdiaboli TaxID=1960589 RepID=UPI000B42D9CA|nr:hypothetical protein [Halalkalibacter urbisdiaboli]
MKRFWLIKEKEQYAVYDSKEKTITNWVVLQNEHRAPEEMILDIRNSAERHDEEVGDIENLHGQPLVNVIGDSD